MYTDDSKMASEFLSFELRTGAFSAFIDQLTTTTQIMIVIADPTIGSRLITDANRRIGCNHDESSSSKETF
jgi:hypothetical protein